jgi:threonine synthase
MRLPVGMLVVATDEPDIPDRFWRSGRYEKHAVEGNEAEGYLVEGAREMLSLVINILVSCFRAPIVASNFQSRYRGNVAERRKMAGAQVLSELKSASEFIVGESVLRAARVDFESKQVSDKQTVKTIRSLHAQGHSTLASPNSEEAYSRSTLPLESPHLCAPSNEFPPDAYHISFATAHPTNFANAVQLALEG